MPLEGKWALNADFSAIQYKLLNSSKGPAVQAPRAQCDKKAYQFRMKFVLRTKCKYYDFSRLSRWINFKKDQCIGVKTHLGQKFYAKSIVVTTGTFLKALMHVGQNQAEGGRLGDHVAKGLSSDFEKVGIELNRFKTGTPPRILGRTIDFEKTTIQKGDKFQRNLHSTTQDLRMKRSMWNVIQGGSMWNMTSTLAQIKWIAL